MSDPLENEPLIEVPQTDIVKGGETCFSFAFERTTKGLKGSIKAHPRVEEFFRTLSHGETTDTVLSGRYWKSVGPGDAPLMAYALTTPLDSLHDGDGRFVIDRLGYPILDPDNDGQDRAGGGGGIRLNDNAGRPYPSKDRSNCVNISFVRLVGISEGHGVSFYVSGVYSTEAVNKLLKGVGEGLRQLYIDYMRPMNVSVQISTQSL